MCGINGLFAYGSAAPAPDERELLATRQAMAARGPDGVGAWRNDDGACAFAHNRLAILDPTPRAAQPMVSADGRYAITFNGQIYNFPALKAELEAKGVVFRTTCDTEALLHLYALKGPDMVRDLRGMFALAIWDEAHRGLFLARDPYGIKPLYIADDGATFRFASQVKALLAGGAVSRDPEPAGVVGFHLFGHTPEPFTLYRDIQALPAGCTLWIDAAGAQTPRPYVSIPAILAEGAARAPDGEIVDVVREAVGDSVAAHMLADVEVGAFLSAGIDSGAMLGLVRDAAGANVRAITLAFDEFRGTDEDEAPLAAQTAARYGARHHVRRVGKAEFLADLPAIMAAMDQPSIDGVNTWFVAKAASETGLKVAISGLGGDELFAGYPSFVDLPNWRRRYGAMARTPGLGAFARLLMGAFAPGLLRERPKAAGMLEYAGTWPGAYFLRRGLFLPHELPALMDADMAREGLARLGFLRRLGASLEPDPGSDIGRVCALESTNYMKNQLLRDADWAGMAHGLEIRTPLVDIELLRTLAPSIPGLAPGAGKAALAAAPQLSLPGDVLSRSKTGFSVPTGAWMAEAAGGEAIALKGLASRGWARRVIDVQRQPLAAIA
jgi:asparagine synthase (glutamine-hydrolysing)